MSAGIVHASGTSRWADDPDLPEVLTGLKATPKYISSRFLYDERGSRLFREICLLPEYYPTRTETRILRAALPQIAGMIGPGALLVEPGSGTSEKTRLLLDHLEKPAGYVPVDISPEQLASAARRLAADYPQLPVTPLCADFTRRLVLPRGASGADRILVFFPGSTIGNFPVAEASELLCNLRHLSGERGALLIGVDLVKPAHLLQAAYNDAAGVTAQFNLNVLRHLNRRFEATFDERLFRHEAPWCPEEHRIEMQLWSERDHFVEIGGTAVHFAAGEKLVTEWSHKYTPDSFAELARCAGWIQQGVWRDPDELFSVQYLVAAGGSA